MHSVTATEKACELDRKYLFFVLSVLPRIGPGFGMVFNMGFGMGSSMGLSIRRVQHFTRKNEKQGHTEKPIDFL